DIYHFVEQFSTCPSLQVGCHALAGPALLNTILTEYKNQGILNNYHNDNLWSIMFYPVKSIAGRTCCSEEDENERLNEMIQIIQKALLK
ncbi:MAG: TetR/AcrR family transcriptional regulator, partial [Vallitaleaceae bacterium]|nr:TetR/AcrR family transcriptional regulator [Vallitaleaceae bacterium]